MESHYDDFDNTLCPAYASTTFAAQSSSGVGGQGSTGDIGGSDRVYEVVDVNLSEIEESSREYDTIKF